MNVEDRPDIDDYYKTLKFRHEDYPPDKYEIMHPTLVTACADILIFPDIVENEKQVIIPVNGSLLEILPYFRAQLEENSGWREVKNSKDKHIILNAPKNV